MEEKIQIKNTKALSKGWGLLNEVTFDYKNNNGKWESQKRESYDTGDGATILLYNTLTKKIILTRQFRLPTYLNGNLGGLLIEACAGLLEQNSPLECAIKEAEEETGYRISQPEKIFEAYMSPGAVTEIMHFFIAQYREEMKVSEGGGLEKEQEDIEVLEIAFQEAWDMVGTGEIKDAKTIMLLQHLKIKALL